MMPLPDRPRKSSSSLLGKPLPSVLMPGKIYLMAHVSAILVCWMFLESSGLACLYLLVMVVDVLSGAVAKNILHPPFLRTTTPEEGLHQDRAMICPYWPEESILGPAAMGIDFKDVEICTPSGCTLHGWMIPAKNGSSNRNTILIMSHGAGRDRRAWLRHCPFLIEAGYSCLMFDFRNHGTSGSFSTGGTFLGWAEWEDMTSVAKWVKGNFPAMKAAFVGTSTGAVSSVIAVAKEPWLGEYVQCIVAENPFTSTSALTDFVVSNVGFKTMLCKGNLLFYSLLYPLCRLVSLATRCKISVALRRAIPETVPSCLEGAEKVNIPILFMHGTADRIVPHTHSEAIAAKIQSAARSCPRHAPQRQHETWICQGGKHCELWDHSRQEFETRVLGFLDKHCASESGLPQVRSAARIITVGSGTCS